MSSCVAIRDPIGEASRKSVGSGVDWASMSPSGDYVVVNVAGRYDILDEQMKLLRTLDIDGGSHADMTYDMAGNEVIVSSYYEGGKGVITIATRLSDNGKQQQLPGPGKLAGIYQASSYHISCRNIDRPGYCYISNFASDSALGAYMFREVFALKLDGTGTVERFSQDFKAPLPLADLDYEPQAHAVPNRDGSLVLFSSDWGDPGSNAIVHDYVLGVRVP